MQQPCITGGGPLDEGKCSRFDVPTVAGDHVQPLEACKRLHHGPDLAVHALVGGLPVAAGPGGRLVLAEDCSAQLALAVRLAVAETHLHSLTATLDAGLHGILPRL